MAPLQLQTIAHLKSLPDTSDYNICSYSLDDAMLLLRAAFNYRIRNTIVTKALHERFTARGHRQGAISMPSPAAIQMILARFESAADVDGTPWNRSSASEVD